LLFMQAEEALSLTPLNLIGFFIFKKPTSIKRGLEP
jgi:hypothetical protein